MNAFTEEELQKIQQSFKAGDTEAAWEACTGPLHQRLLAAQSFDVLDELQPAPRMALILDYLEQQIGQGGFIQLFQNGYAPLLLESVEILQELKMAPDMTKAFDEALRLFSTYHSELGKQTTVEEFARLYQQFPQFQPLEVVFGEELAPLKNHLLESITLAK